MNTTETDLIFERYTQTKIPFEKMNILTPDQWDQILNFKNFDGDDWKWNAIQKKFIRVKKVEEDAVEDDENYDSEGAVNLLEQLKAEVPELEDKINQVLEKVFVAVDILKQEPYTDDPQLVKAYASLIEGDF